MDIRKQLVEVTESSIKKSLNMEGFGTAEFGLNAKNVSFKFTSGIGVDVAVKVEMETALEMFYDHLVQVEEIDAGTVGLDEFKSMYSRGMAVEEMVAEIAEAQEQMDLETE